jgi:antitoxin component of MazEF toxin-antitoxin module
MQFERKIREIGGSIQLIIPADLAKYLNININDTVMIQDENGRYGKYISFWKKEEKNEN